jgi:phosphoribosylglycinamide formyltransferase-1
MKKIAILASGSGSNAEKIAEYFKHSSTICVDSIYTNNPKAGVVERASRLGIPCFSFTRDEFQHPAGLLKQLTERSIDLVVLAGFLWLIPAPLVEAYRGRMLNIHPSLLPSFGGKGFYGQRVHQAVVDARAIMSGITIHSVNEHFDEGYVVFQAACYVSPEDNAETLADKIHKLEHAYFPVVIEKFLQS